MRRLVLLLTAICLLAGCGPVSVGETPQEESLSPVYTDWSKLTPYEPPETKYTYFEPYSGSGPLQARDDYGLLLPYVGAELSVDNYILDRLPLYGLTTADGRIVTAPVYASIALENGFLRLYRGSGALYQQETPMQERGDFDLTVAALDGSWVKEVDGYYVCSTKGLLVTADRDGSLFYWDSRGELAHRFSAEAFQPYLGTDFNWGGEGGPWLDQTDSRVVYITSYNHSPDGETPLRLYLDLEQEAVLETPPDGYPAEIDYGSLYQETPQFPGYRNIWPMTDPATDTVYYCAQPETETSAGAVLLSDSGEVILPEFDSLWISFPQIIGGYAASVEYQNPAAQAMAGGTFSWRRLDNGELVFRCLIHSNAE